MSITQRTIRSAASAASGLGSYVRVRFSAYCQARKFWKLVERRGHFARSDWSHTLDDVDFAETICFMMAESTGISSHSFLPDDDCYAALDLHNNRDSGQLLDFLTRIERRLGIPIGAVKVEPGTSVSELVRRLYSRKR